MNTYILDSVLPTHNAYQSRVYWVLYLAATVLLCVPVWMVEYPALTDARMYALDRQDQDHSPSHTSDAAQARAAYAAREASSWPFKVFMTFVLVLLMAGFHLLGRAIHGRAAVFR